jgi:hypothetical protein
LRHCPAHRHELLRFGWNVAAVKQPQASAGVPAA